MRTSSSLWTAVLGAVVLGVTALALMNMSTGAAERAAPHYVPAVAVLVIASAAVVIWYLDPAYTLSASILLTPFAGNWPELGVPGQLSPDRWLLAGGILAVLLRAPPVSDRPRLQIAGSHMLLALAAGYAVVSAYLADTLFERDALFKMVDAFGVMPFLLFLVAPLAFRTPQQRSILLATFVGLGTYLGLTAIFEAAKVDALVFPAYILDTSYGIHVGRGRGPFVDAVANGLALYTCAVACAIAAASWRTNGARAFAIAIGLVCMAGTFLCVERSAWIGAALGTIVAMLATRGLRRYLLPTAAAVAIAVAATLLFIPGVSRTAQERANNSSTIWDRQNLARAAVNMVEAKPLVGFGWNRFSFESADYFQQAFDYPLTATEAGIHNTPLTYAVELGLLGTTLWLLGALFGIGTALTTRGPPELMRWRTGLLAIATASVVVVNAVPPTAWLNRSLWLFAGVVYSGRYLGR